MKKFLLLCSAICIQYSTINFAFAQKEFNIWYFGYYAGLDFNSGAPVGLNNSALSTGEGSSSIADANGNLLFYTDGLNVWNRNHVVMPNGSGLFGGFGSSTQSALIIKKPLSINEYYIFTLDEQGGTNGFCYSIVDMNLQGGNGDVTVKNFPACNYIILEEKLTATQHINGTDVWVIIHEDATDGFRSYRFTPAGLDTNAVISNAGTIQTNPYGQMKASPDGTKLAFGCYDPTTYFTVQIFDFDKATGIVSNAITVPTTYAQTYGVEFSPNSRYLYAGSYFVNEMHQFDVLAGSSAAVIASDIIVGTSIPSYGSLQLAPDGKIYFTESPTNLGSINSPDNAGALCNYANASVTFTSGSSALGLPNFFPSGFITQPPVINFIASDRFICPGTCINFTNLTSGATSYQWFFTGAMPDTSTEVNPSFICYNTPGLYSVTLIATNSVGTDTVTLNNLIHVYPQPINPVITQIGNVLQSTTGYLTYQWFYGSDSIEGATNNSYYGQQNGNYNLVVTDSNGCAVGGGILNVIFEPDGVNEFNVQSLMFNVYPNPAKDMLCVTGYMLYKGEISFEIYNSLGEKIYSVMLSESEATRELKINTTNFSSGIYLMKITSGGHIFTSKIVIAK